jgi:hypothetical protein
VAAGGVVAADVLRATGLHVLAVAGVGVALVTAGWAFLASTNRRLPAGLSACLPAGSRVRVKSRLRV